MIIENNEEEYNVNNNNINNNNFHTGEFRPWGLDKRQYLMFMHISQFAGIVIAGLGFVLPIVMWLSFKDEDAEIDAHGREIMNWTISFIIYACIAGILVFLFIGIFLLLGLAIASIVFIIMAAIEAKEGRFYRYPLTIRFI